MRRCTQRVRLSEDEPRVGSAIGGWGSSVRCAPHPSSHVTLLGNAGAGRAVALGDDDTRARRWLLLPMAGRTARHGCPGAAWTRELHAVKNGVGTAGKTSGRTHAGCSSAISFVRRPTHSIPSAGGQFMQQARRRVVERSYTSPHRCLSFFGDIFGNDP